MHRCGRCLSVSYCSQACADNNWDKHKAECVEINGGREARKNKIKSTDSNIKRTFETAGLKDLADFDTKCKMLLEKQELVESTNSLDEVD